MRWRQKRKVSPNVKKLFSFEGFFFSCPNLFFFGMHLFNINISSFKARLIFSFVMAGFVTLFLVIVTITQMFSIVRLQSYIRETLQPTQLYLQSVRTGLQESMYYCSTSFEEDKTDRRLKWENVWNNQIPTALDSLKRLHLDWKEAKSFDFYRQLRKSIMQMKPLQNDCMIFLNRSERFGIPPGEQYYLARERLTKLDEDTKMQIRTLMEIKDAQIRDGKVAIEKQIVSFRSAEFIFLTISFIVGVVIAWLVSRSILTQIRKMSDTIVALAAGNLPSSVPKFENELKEITQSISHLVDNFRKLKDFALQVGKGEYHTSVSVFSKEGELGVALEQMRSSLQTLSEEEKKRFWQNKGVSQFVEILGRNHDDINMLGGEVIRNLTNFLNCNQGGIYIVDDPQATVPNLMLIAYYAFEKKKFIRQTFDSREGLIGQACQEKKIIHLCEIPEEYALITSGVGGARPKSLVISPLMINEIVFGILELASFSSFEDYEIDFIEKLSVNLAATFSNVSMNTRTRRLLEVSQQQAEQMRAQEEEMRQNMEELQATQEEMRKKTLMLEESRARGNAFFQGAINPVVFLNAEGKIEEINKAAEKLFAEDNEQLKGKTFNNLINLDFRTAIGMMQNAQLTADKNVYLNLHVKQSEVAENLFFVVYMRNVTKNLKQHDVLKKQKEALQEQVEELKEQNDAAQQAHRKKMAEKAQQFELHTTGLQTQMLTQEKQNKRLDALLKNTPIPLAWKDSSLKFVGANEAFLKLTGLTEEQILGGDHDAMPWAAQTDYLWAIEQKIWESGELPKQTEDPKKSPEDILPHFNWIPLKNTQGKVDLLLIANVKEKTEKTTAAPQENPDFVSYQQEIEHVRKAIGMMQG